MAGTIDPSTSSRSGPAAPDGYLDLDAGHGTFVTGIVQQIAPGAEVRVYRAVDSDGIGSEVAVACKMIKAVQEAPRSSTSRSAARRRMTSRRSRCAPPWT